jgi:hypothetical protein
VVLPDRATVLTTYEIGQAMRIALALGMNREPPSDHLDHTDFVRRRRAWWTVYIIDKKLSVMVGAPSSIKDDDIDISLPDLGDLGYSNSALRLHVKLASLEGSVISGTRTVSSQASADPRSCLPDKGKDRCCLHQGHTRRVHLDDENCGKLPR